MVRTGVTTASAHEAIEQAPRGHWLAVTSLCLVQFVDVLGVTVVVTTLPGMLSDIGAPASFGALIATGYAMFFGGLLMLGARLGDRYGHRRVILASLIVFAVGAAVVGAANSVLWITVGRCLQGAAAAGSVPSALRLLTTVTEEGPQRQRAIAVWSAAGAAAGASGFIVGGLVSSIVSWRFVFWGYLPLAAAMAAGILHAVPADTEANPHRSLNVGSAITFTACVMAFVLGTSLISEPSLLLLCAVLIGAAAFLGWLFVLIDQRTETPLLPSDLLRCACVRQGALGSSLNTGTTSSAVTLVTLYLQNHLGTSPLVAAATLLPLSLAVIVGSSCAAALLRVWQPQTVVAIGLALIAVSDLGYILANSSVWAFGAFAAAGGLGLGTSSVATTGLGTSVESHWRGTASGIINTAAQIGTALGIALLLLVAVATTGAPSNVTSAPYVAWGVAGLISAGGAVYFLSNPAAVGRLHP